MISIELKTSQYQNIVIDFQDTIYYFKNEVDVFGWLDQVDFRYHYYRYAN